MARRVASADARLPVHPGCNGLQADHPCPGRLIPNPHLAPHLNLDGPTVVYTAQALVPGPGDRVVDRRAHRQWDLRAAPRWIPWHLACALIARHAGGAEMIVLRSRRAARRCLAGITAITGAGTLPL